MKATKYKYSVRPNKHISTTIDPNTQDYLSHIRSIIDYLQKDDPKRKTISDSIIVRRALKCLSEHYDSLIDEEYIDQQSDNELYELRNSAKPSFDIFEEGIIDVPFNESPLTFKDKYTIQSRINQEDNEIRLKRMFDKRYYYYDYDDDEEDY